jgi:hypothetical protein
MMVNFQFVIGGKGIEESTQAPFVAVQMEGPLMAVEI